MILCHFALVHAFQGAFFGWLGILGALAPDLLGIIGWMRYLSAPIKVAGDDWWDYMTDFCQAAYQAMHSVWFFVAVLLLEMTLRIFVSTVSLGFGCSLVPSFALGYLTHIVADIFTHRQHVGMFILAEGSGPILGVDWFRSKFYWTEWTGIGLCVLVYLLGANNTFINLCVGIFQ